MTVAQLQQGGGSAAAAAFHVGSAVWVPVLGAPTTALAGTEAGSKQRTKHWRRATVQALSHEPAANGSSANGISTTGSGLILDVETENGQLLQAVPADECCLQNERDDTVDDLVRSDFLHEPGILHTLRVRYGLDSIYTYSGNILIAANPHKRLRALYGGRMMAQYRGVPLGELSPHVYAIAEQAYSAMMAEGGRQAILISGESGAGKTESAKLVMQYLAHRAAPPHSHHTSSALHHSLARTGSGAAAAHHPPANGMERVPIEEQVLESNPLLEAFGNAKTLRNDNSSRFGKFVEIDFDAAGRVSGASISTYLLERSRVVSVKPPERSYHIFYQLCAGADDAQRTELRLEGGAPSFRYLSQSDTYTLKEVDDAAEFGHTLDAMRIVGLRQEHIDTVLRLVACVLHLGNVEFVSAGAGDDARVASGQSAAALEAAAQMLGVHAAGLETALTTRAIETRGERIVKRLDPAAAAESRDALAKTLYARLFDWLVAAINRKIGSLGSSAAAAAAAANGGGSNGSVVPQQPPQRSIGILDIYGFERFENNSFEQLCINLANERLQQQFNAHVFKGEQEEYASEGIAWSWIDFIDNQDCLQLLEGGAGCVGVFPLIDEACRLPCATHQDLAHALRTQLVGHPRFGAPRRAQNAFVVGHYAGEVPYSTELLLDKNKDFVVAEHAALLGASGVELVRELFAADAAAAASGGAAADAIPASAGSELPSPQKAAFGGRGEGAASKGPMARRSAFMLSSVGARFRRQLGGLMGTLAGCQPHYIRCIKPNPASQPGNLETEYVLEQLRAGGVLEAVRIACAGFPTRKPLLQFAQRYSLLLPGGPAAARLPLSRSGFVDWYSAGDEQLADATRRVLRSAALDGWQLGTSRVFLRAGQLAALEGARGRRLSEAAIRIQAAARGALVRRELQHQRQAAVQIQSAWRGHTARAAAATLRRQVAATKVQAAWRMHVLRTAYLHQRRERAATVLQSYARMWAAQRRFRYETELGRRQAARAAEEAARAAAATTIQAHERRRAAQKQASLLRVEAARYASLQQALEAAQAERSAAEAERDSLAGQLAEAQGSAQRAEAEAAALQARIAALASELAAAQLQASQAQAAAAEAVASASAGAAAEASAAAAAQLRAAHEAASAAAAAELELLRRQRAAADARAQSLETEVRDLQQQTGERKRELDAVLAAAQRKDSENVQLWEQVKQAAEESRREFDGKEAELASAKAQAEAARREAAAARERAQAQAQKEIVGLQEELRAARAAAETAQSAGASAVRGVEERTGHMAARVEALTERTQRLEGELRTAAAREEALLAELESAKRAAAVAAVRSPTKAGMAGAHTPQRDISAQLEAAAAAAADANGGAAAEAAEGRRLAPAHAAALAALQAAAVDRQLSTVAAAGAATPMPLAAWLLCEALQRWSAAWPAREVDAAADALQGAVVEAAVRGGLLAQAYWFAASLAAGALLKVKNIGRREGGRLVALGDSLIFFSPLHEALGDTIADALPVNVALLLSDEAKRTARRRPTPSPLPAGAAASPDRGTAPGSQWRALLGGVTNMLEALRAAGVPAPAVRAVAWACLRYVDAELLNALLLRRDCCSVSAAKALQAGLADLHSWADYMADEADRALERVSQAARYLVQGKEDCMRKAHRGVDILPDLGRVSPALTLQQVYRLTEHQHDDWIAGGAVGGQNVHLLETLQRLMAEQRARAALGENAGELPEAEEEDLLVEPREAFLLPRKQLTEAARCFVQAPPPPSTAPPATPQRALQRASTEGGASGTPATPASVTGSPLRLPLGPRLPNGSLPTAAAAAGATANRGPAAASCGPDPQTGSGPLSGLALIDAIGQACRTSGQLPGQLTSRTEFGFLTAS